MYIRRPGIHPLYQPIDEHDLQEQARADAYRARVRDAALRQVAQTRTELFALPAESTGHRIGLRGCIGTEVRRAIENGANTEQISAALNAPLTDPDGHPVHAEFVRLTLPKGTYAQWADYGPDRPALVTVYTRDGEFAGLERTSYATDETTAGAIARLTAARPDARLSRLTRDEAAAAPQTTTEEGQSQC